MVSFFIRKVQPLPVDMKGASFVLYRKLSLIRSQHQYSTSVSGITRKNHQIPKFMVTESLLLPFDKVKKLTLYFKMLAG